MAGALVRGPIYSSNPSTMNIHNYDDSKHRCKCCPYGYHIDLDFVHFCELFSQNNTLSASKQRRREKRLQRQSMEVLLGLTSPVVWNLEHHLPKIPQEDCTASSSSCSQTAKIVQDALHGAVQDFQETLERAQCPTSADKTVFMPANGELEGRYNGAVQDFQETLERAQYATYADKAAFMPGNEELEGKYNCGTGASPELDVCATVIKQSESVVSLSSIGARSYSPSYANREVPDGIIYSALRVVSPINDYDTSSITSAASGLSAGALQNIREQMALSLKRMKELEEQVKLIPVLQVQLSVLKEEKRKLLLQLRQEEVGKASNNNRLLRFDQLHKASKQNYDSLNFNNTIPRCSKDDEKNWFPNLKKSEENEDFACQYCSKVYSLEESCSGTHLKTSLARQGSQDIGITCSVVTRDVGVCHQQPRMYDAETYVNFQKFFTLEKSNKLNLTSNDCSQRSSEKVSYLPKSLNCILSKRDIAVNTSCQGSKVGVQTEIYRCHASTQIDFCMPKPKRIFVSYKIPKDNKRKKRKTRLVRKLRNISIVKNKSVGVMTEFEHASDKLDEGVSLSCSVNLESEDKNDINTAMWSSKFATSSKCIDTSEFFVSRIKDVGVNTLKVQLIDAAVGDRNLNVSHQNVSYQSSVRNIAVNTEKAKMVDIGVGSKIYKQFQMSVSCQCNMAAKMFQGNYRNTATNTEKTKVSDIAVGNSYSNLVPKNVSCQCNIQASDSKSSCKDNVLDLQRLKMVDAVVGCDDRPLFQRSVSCQCEPMTEESFVSNSKKSPSPSRIPRPIDRCSNTPQHMKDKVQFQYFEKELAHTKFPLKHDNVEKISMPGLKNIDDVTGKEHDQELCSKLTVGDSTEPICHMDETKEEIHHKYQTLLKHKRFQTSPASVGLHMLVSSKLEHSIQRENKESCLENRFTFQPIQDVDRKKSVPSKEMKAAIKVLNDCLLKSNSEVLPNHVKSAANIIQQEWFHVSSTSSAAPLEVEDYLDFFEETSSKLLEYVVNMTDISGNTAMHYAVSHGNFDVVSILLDSKVCNINQPNAAGYTCVMLVSLAEICSETHRQVVRHLFQLADVNVKAQQHGQTALMLAVSHGRLDTVKLLIEAGADMNIQDEDGSTALMCAAEHGHKDIVKQLLSNPDCDVTIADCDGTTALDIAMEAGNRDIGVLIYGRQAFSRSTSPHISRHRRSKSATPVVHTSLPLHIQASQTTDVIKTRHDKTL